MNFADRLIAATDEFGPLCVGLDPHAGRIPDLFGGDTPEGVEAWGLAMVEAAKGRTGVIKPQSAFYERLGWQGMRALTHILEAARDAGLVVLMDAKRGDIGSTAEGYAAAFLAENAPFPSDALTVNPYMGVDTLEPHVNAAEANGKGVIVLARTSNPGSADFQSKSLEGAPLYERIVEALAPMIDRLKGESGWSGLMLVTGATGPQEARRLRELAPDALFLVPGYGAQGAGAADAMSGFVLRGNRLSGGVVSASRSVSFPPEAQSASTLDEWRTAIAGAINAAQADLMVAATR
ncbi:MAG TPA: orotidine-5'-phosphate decarboxylase [Henriciella marina]|uniref:orotidine-5'-phosphate decarboxylase n=1 Tax=Henriciella sp. TaxID=1968823 RepID=UPI0017FFF558|nr:orotidine-5'-phosphate decarboxylase [Henriciella sp.]HIG22431.1 orotidine-5'-phosphate decarboxylase [Henriciella sp.]HIK65842.1 orotidine-5'-phosphate decarboxylase [Henriciella marina]